MKPLLGGLLIGGASRRMGQPKHLLSVSGRTFFEHTLAAMRPLCDEVLVLGAGELPPHHEHLRRLEDVDGVYGPAAGILAALRHNGSASWLVVACDMPRLHSDALAWLRDEHRVSQAGATMPDVSGHVLPTCAVYTAAVTGRLEAHGLAGRGPRALAAEDDVHTPVSVDIAAFTNVNTPEDYATWVSE